MKPASEMSVEEMFTHCFVGGGDEEAGRRWEAMEELARRLRDAEAEYGKAMTLMSDLVKTADTYKARADAAEAVVARLQHTKDGVPITWHLQTVWRWTTHKKPRLERTYAMNIMTGRQCWSTREAAEKSRSTTDPAEAARSGKEGADGDPPTGKCPECGEDELEGPAGPCYYCGWVMGKEATDGKP